MCGIVKGSRDLALLAERLPYNPSPGSFEDSM